MNHEADSVLVHDVDFWEAHAARRLAQGPPGPLEAPERMEWTQRPGIGPAADLLGRNLTGLRIVELGCGSGRNTAHLAAAGSVVVGVDHSAGQIRRAQAHYGHTGAAFVHADATAYLGEGSEPLDAIVSVFGAIGTTEPSRLLSACSQRLSRKGVLAFSLPHPQRTGTMPTDLRTRRGLALPGTTAAATERWDTDPSAWARAINRAGLVVTGMRHLFAPADARRPTTLLITARKP